VTQTAEQRWRIQNTQYKYSAWMGSWPQCTSHSSASTAVGGGRTLYIHTHIREKYKFCPEV